jgi:branched-chain amino acid transport system substrate-binding protein
MKFRKSVRFAGAAVAAAGLTAMGLVALAQAQTPPPLKIGVMDGFSGVYGDLTAGEVEAMQMAIEDVGGKVLGRSVEILSADHQTKPDVGASIARRWYDVDGVKMITGLGTSSVALAVRKVSQEKGLIDINTGAASADLTGPACSETGAHWVYDTYALAHVTGSAMVKAGGDSWFFLTADYAFGHALERDVSEVVKAAGGKVVGGVKHPLNTQDFSSYVLQADASKAKNLLVANGGGDIVNAVKQAAEFGLMKKGVRISAPLAQNPDIHGIGLKIAQGLLISSPFYYDMTPEAKAYTERFTKEIGRPPSFIQAGTYGAVMHYLKAVKAAGTDEAKAVMAKMREMPINDFMTKNGKVREDGQVVRDMYLMQAKTPEESKGEWDLVKMVATVPGSEAFRPLDQGECPLVTKKK